MKPYRYILTLLLVAVLLTGCSNMLFTTAEYRSYQAFSNQHKAGMEKQEIWSKLGCPNGYYDAQGNYQNIPSADSESVREILMADSCAAWVYECWKRPDPADPYRLTITFNAEGNSESATLNLVPGG